MTDLDGLHHPLAGLGIAALLQQHAGGADGGDGIDDVLAGVLRRAAAHRLEHAQPAGIGIDVAARRHAHAALQDAGQVGDDVAEHVRGHDHVEYSGFFTIHMQQASTWL